MRILLVSPKNTGRGQASVPYINAAPLSLATLKALTPDDVELKILDENTDLRRAGRGTEMALAGILRQEKH